MATLSLSSSLRVSHGPANGKFAMARSWATSAFERLYLGGHMVSDVATHQSDDGHHTMRPGTTDERA
jgi:hypothetical protein